MATIGSIVIGMKVDTRMLTKGLNAASKHVDSFVSGIAGGLTALAGAAIFSKVTEGIVEVAKSSSELNEQVSKSQQVFGDASAKVEADAKAMGDAFGYPKSQFIDGASSIGLIAKASGMSQQAAADMGSSFSKLAADVSSFYNVDVEEGLAAIRSGLVGEAEPMRRFGVLLSEAAVQAEAVRLGLSRTGKELTEGQKVQARASLITKGLADAQGDLARTAGGAANQVRTIWGRITNLSADVGTAIQPAIDAVLGFANGALVKVSTAFQSGKGFLSDYIASLGGLFSAIGDLGSQLLDYLGPAITSGQDLIAGWARAFIDGIDTVASVIRNLPAYFEVAGLRIQQFTTNVIEWIGVLPENLAIIGEWIGTNWYQLIMTGLDAVLTLFINLGTNIRNLGSAIIAFLSDPTQGFNFTPLLDGFRSTVAELPKLLEPELTSMQSMIDEKLAAIGDKEAQRAVAAAADTAKKIDAAAKKPAEALASGPAKQGAEVKFAGAMELGSSAAISAINQFRAGSGDNSMREVAKESKTQTGLLASIDKKLGGAVKPAADKPPIMAF